MKNERLLDALEKIDEELIAEAAPGNKPPKKKAKNMAWVKWGAMAACALVIVGIGAPHLFNHEGPDGAVTEGKPETEGNISDITSNNGVQEEAGEGETDGVNYGEGEPTGLSEMITINEITEPLAFVNLPNLREDIRKPMTGAELYEYYGINLSEALSRIADYEEREGGYPKGIYTYADGSIFDMNQFAFYEPKSNYELYISIGRNTKCGKLPGNLDTDAKGSEINGIDMLLFKVESDTDVEYYAVFEFGECDYIVSGVNVEEDAFVKILGTITK